MPCFIRVSLEFTKSRDAAIFSCRTGRKGGRLASFDHESAVLVQVRVARALQVRSQSPMYVPLPVAK